jgi:hypothetical protein
VTASVVWYAVKRCAKRAGIDNLAPHDLRRTCARLCHEAGGELEQIQFLLGHASVQTTERYIGCRQNLREAVNDRFRISPSNNAAYEVLGVPRDNPVYHVVDEARPGPKALKTVRDLRGTNSYMNTRPPSAEIIKDLTTTADKIRALAHADYDRTEISIILGIRY